MVLTISKNTVERFTVTDNLGHGGGLFCGVAGRIWGKAVVSVI